MKTHLLDEWYKKSGYEDIKIFVDPRIDTTVQECADEIYASIQRLQRGELRNISHEIL